VSPAVVVGARIRRSGIKRVILACRVELFGRTSQITPADHVVTVKNGVQGESLVLGLCTNKSSAMT
jgi:hypothetical protein